MALSCGAELIALRRPALALLARRRTRLGGHIEGGAQHGLARAEKLGDADSEGGAKVTTVQCGVLRTLPSARA